VGERRLDLVGVVDRTEQSLRLYEVDPHSRQLRRIDAGIATGENYGGALYCSAKSGKTYFFVTSKTAGVSQFELFDAGNGLVGGRKVRHWPLGKCEGAVAADQAGSIYIAEERRGVWHAGAEPDDAGPGQLVVPQGARGVSGDVEGLALVDAGEDQRWLIVSNQAANRFEVFRAAGDHPRLGSFAVENAEHTDGLDAIAVPLGPRFSSGVFACHSAAAEGCPILLASWAEVRKRLEGSAAAKQDLSHVRQD
jgi:3-phytase